MVSFVFRNDFFDVLSASVFDPSNSLHGALHFLSVRLAGPSLRTCCEVCSYSLGHRRVIRLSWHDSFFLSVLGSGSLTPVWDFTISYIILHSFSFFLSSLHIRPSRFFPEYLNALCPGFHRSQAFPRCRGTDSNAEVHVQSYRHPRCTRLLIFTSLSLSLPLSSHLHPFSHVPPLFALSSPFPLPLFLFSTLVDELLASRRKNLSGYSVQASRRLERSGMGKRAILTLKCVARTQEAVVWCVVGRVCVRAMQCSAVLCCGVSCRVVSVVLLFVCSCVLDRHRCVAGCVSVGW